MKAKYLIVSLGLASICFSCSYIGPDREDDLIIITDKGPGRETNGFGRDDS